MIRLLLVLMTISTAIPTMVSAQEFTKEQQAQIETMFKDYLLENGEIVLESVNKYQGELAEKEQAAANEKAKSFVKELDKRAELATAGNLKGDVTIVEFFDYNCGYCSRALEEIETVLKEDDNIRVIFMDMPILGPSSLEASKWSLAAQKQGKYWDYHRAIMHFEGPKDESTLEKLAKEIGLDIEQLKKDKDSEEITTQLEKNIEEARSLNINGTPGFIINGEISPGYIPAAQMKRIIKEARS